MFGEPLARIALMAPELKCQCGAEPFVDWWINLKGVMEVFVRCNKCGKIGQSADTEDGAILAWDGQAA